MLHRQSSPVSLLHRRTHFPNVIGRTFCVTSFSCLSQLCAKLFRCSGEGTNTHKRTNKKERRNKWEKLKDERKRVHKRTTREREERYVCICVKRRKRKDPFAKTVLYCLLRLRHRPRRFTFVSRQWHRPLAAAAAASLPARRSDVAHSSAISSHRKVCPFFDIKPRRRSIIR